MVIDGHATAVTSGLDIEAPTPPAQIQGATSSHSDQLAAAAIHGVENYWRENFPTTFGKPWINIHGYFAVDPNNPKSIPSCVKPSVELADQALYCPQLDAVAWDRVELIPRLSKTYGSGAVMVALAHEMGHAIQNRLGIDATTQLTERGRYPTILLEGMADCFAGSALRGIADGRVPALQLSRPDLDRTLRALLSFRDSASIGDIPEGAHGDAFDRASAFIDGYTNGPNTCASMTVSNQIFTQRGYTTYADAQNNGNLDLSKLLDLLLRDTNTWFGQLVTQRGRSWQPPVLTFNTDARCATPTAPSQGPAWFCPSNNTLVVSSGALGSVHDSLGDYASGVLLVSRYAWAAMAALGRPVQSPDASHTALCLAGAYTRTVFDRQSDPHFPVSLSPGDIDEAVDELLDDNYAARDLTGTAPSGELGFTRVQHFRAGVIGGPAKCGL